MCERHAFYHVIARCVRRAWLWGFDEYAGRDYSHRKRWVIERLEYLLSSIFAIDICAYAVMSNHYRLVVHVDRDRIRACTDEEIIERWSHLFRVPTIVKRWREGIAHEAEAIIALQIIECWRAGLIDVSWFMRCLNEYLARRANAEDRCTGRFWMGRFKSQALLDEAGLLTAMAYVDLNPVRAGMLALRRHQKPQSSRRSMRVFRHCDQIVRTHKHRYSFGLINCFVSVMRPADASAIPFTLPSYSELVDWSGRVVCVDKRGAIDGRAPPILTRLNIDPGVRQGAMGVCGNVFGRALGKLDHLRLHAKVLGQSRIKGLM